MKLLHRVVIEDEGFVKVVRLWEEAGEIIGTEVEHESSKLKRWADLQKMEAGQSREVTTCGLDFLLMRTMETLLEKAVPLRPKT